MNNGITIIKDLNAQYPDNHDFLPCEVYPEYPWGNDTGNNGAYGMVRESFHIQGMDLQHFGTSEWNPLKEYVFPGDTVLIKPNLVHHSKSKDQRELCLYTDPSVVAPVIDYCFIALKGRGKIIIGDAPVQGCDFDQLIQESGYDSLVSCYQNRQENVEIVLKDFRELIASADGLNAHQTISDVKNSVVVDLKDRSAFCGNDESYYDNLRITGYTPDELKKHHTKDRHEYCICRDVLQADVIINMPKPKTHRKAGITASLKNMIGVSARKEYLPHHCMGAKADGGDEYENRNHIKAIQAKYYDLFNQAKVKQYSVRARIYYILIIALAAINKVMKGERVREGNWAGNNTICKTIADINLIIKYADKNGMLQNKPQRRMLIIADMIVAGQGEGPLMPRPYEAGIIAISDNPFIFDCTIAKIMGADIDKLPFLKTCKGLFTESASVNETVHSNDINYAEKSYYEIAEVMHFAPPDGWSDVFS